MQKIAEPPFRRQAALVLLIVLIALNLRSFLAAPGPILPRIAADTELSYGALSLLTLLPMLLMGAGAFVSPVLQAIIGTRRGLLAALGLLLIGSFFRLFAWNGNVLILTAAASGAGVAFVQSALPGLIKEKFPHSTASMAGFYSAMIMTGGAVGAQLTPLLANSGLSWRAALAWLALPALVALLATARLLPETRATRPCRDLTGRLLRCPRTWTLMAMFGLVNGGYSSLIAWLALYYQELGWSGAASGTLISVMALSQGCGAVALPLLARNRLDRRPWLWSTIALQAFGFAGLAFAPSALPVVWAASCGFGLAGSFALSLLVALDHFSDARQAGPLAALMQGGGFLITAAPPFLLASLHDATGSFESGWVMHLALIAAAAILAYRFDPNTYHRAMTCQPVTSHRVPPRTGHNPK
ncbi:cyanate transporter [Leisingera daeponensis]|uniref:cyanate transporter n=1 Tax=Leisingera daeponensis TaxID=405746 RepID=UPI001C96B09A|nr:cyanate transporter [Leisingera daeponensis]MBY6059383.1 cyanate transporter [Leisingera daeponensis]